jgi:hypothetical protein
MCATAAKRGLIDAAAFIFLLITISGIATVSRNQVIPFPTVMVGILMISIGGSLTVMTVAVRVIMFGFPFTYSCLQEEQDEPRAAHIRQAPPPPLRVPSPPPSPPTQPSSPREQTVIGIDAN